MNNKLFFLVGALLLTGVIFAQDIIVTKNAKKIDAKILEVSKSEIKYKEIDNLEGPTFILNTDDIVTIIYANGKVVLYNDESSNNEHANKSVKKANPVNIDTGSNASWHLEGRSIRGTLPQPSNTFTQEGSVVVEIVVNAAGNVISATIKGGNISDYQTQQLALDAARKAKFTEGDHEQIGTITFNFKFN